MVTGHFREGEGVPCGPGCALACPWAREVASPYLWVCERWVGGVICGGQWCWLHTFGPSPVRRLTVPLVTDQLRPMTVSRSVVCPWG